MIDFAAEQPPSLRRQLRRRPLNLPPAPGLPGIPCRDQFGRPMIATWDMVHSLKVSEMQKFDCLPQWRRKEWSGW